LDDHQFARLLAFLNYSWDGYLRVRKGVKKRVGRHMQELGCRHIDQYLARLETDPGIRAECERRMTVSISRFFRDRRLWEILENHVLPEVSAQGRGSVRVWFAGCAGGEEVYSLRILWEEFAAGCKIPPALFVIATDVAPQYLERAREGIYPRGALREVDAERLARWFVHVNKQHDRVKPSVKEGIDWRVHDFLADDPPAKDLDIVFLRNNLLTYYANQLAEPPLERVIDALRPAGFLVIGAKEEMPAAGLRRLRRYDRYVFRKKAKPESEYNE
jgi:chemotaxis protein methyltransferase CheR